MGKSFLWLMMLIFGFTIKVQAQILYRISGNRLELSSYIVGTYHFAPASFADSILVYNHLP